MFQSTNNPSWIHVLFIMSFLAMVLIQKDTSVMIPSHGNSVTMDVTFLETEYFFNEPSSSVLQGENRHEQQIWDWVHLDHTQTELVITEQINHTDLHTQATSNNPFSNIQHDQNQNRRTISTLQLR
jgi:hypothetical protein